MMLIVFYTMRMGFMVRGRLLSTAMCSLKGVVNDDLRI